MKPKFFRRGKLWCCFHVMTRNQRQPTRMLFVFSNRGFNTMIRNFRAGNCPITQKGLYKYSDRCTPCNLTHADIPTVT